MAKTPPPATKPAPEPLIYKCEEMITQPVLRGYNAAGAVESEIVLRPTKVFRASAPDLWSEADKAADALTKQQQGANASAARAAARR